VPGLSTLDVANILKDMGCTQALNLDGGGSTMMLVNGKPVIKSSDGTERKVVSAVSMN
jgi:exopolysaccharide biosynthesis protein